MVTVTIARKGIPESNMEFEFEEFGPAIEFILKAKRTYREDDLITKLVKESNNGNDC